MAYKSDQGKQFKPSEMETDLGERTKYLDSLQKFITAFQSFRDPVLSTHKEKTSFYLM